MRVERLKPSATATLSRLFSPRSATRFFAILLESIISPPFELSQNVTACLQYSTAARNVNTFRDNPS
nr:MAG TPA: hypothetical protein [Caudoviricetes sp.]